MGGGGKVGDEWVESFDELANRAYYVNLRTYKSVWNVPDDKLVDVKEPASTRKTRKEEEDEAAAGVIDAVVARADASFRIGKCRHTGDSTRLIRDTTGLSSSSSAWIFGALEEEDPESRGTGDFCATSVSLSPPRLRRRESAMKYFLNKLRPPPAAPPPPVRLVGGGSSTSTASSSLSSQQQQQQKEEMRSDHGMALEDVQVLRNLGSGSFSQVVLIRKLNEPEVDEWFAMKIVDKTHEAYYASSVRAERAALVALNYSDFVVSLCYAFQSARGLYLLMPYYSGGSLNEHLPRGGMGKARAVFHAAELSLALRHAHSRGIVHRDVKTSNVLLDHTGHVALGDFGLCAHNVKPGAQPLKTFCGSVEYMAPEILRGQNYGRAVDWWSLGVVLYELLYARLPFHSSQPRETFERILKHPPEFFDEARADAPTRQSIRSLLCKDPDQRHTADLPVFRDMDWRSLEKRTLEPPYRPPTTTPSLRAAPNDQTAALAHEFTPGTPKKQSKKKKKKKKDKLSNFAFNGHPTTAKANPPRSPPPPQFGTTTTRVPPISPHSNGSCSSITTSVNSIASPTSEPTTPTYHRSHLRTPIPRLSPSVAI